jgi:hypothetical protein
VKRLYLTCDRAFDTAAKNQRGSDQDIERAVYARLGAAEWTLAGGDIASYADG